MITKSRIPLFGILLFILLAFTGCGERISNGETAIRLVMQNAEDGWNTGNLESYMNCYLRSDDLRFAGDDRISFGWHTVLENYIAAYPDPASMGQLDFYNLDIKFLADDAALVVGRWRLDRENDQPHGVFTLIMQRVSEGWRIIHDHTGSSDGTLSAAEASITQADLISQVTNLTSDKMDGRLPGTRGYRLAAETVAEHFSSLGLKPGTGNGYLQELPIEANEVLGQPSFQKVGSNSPYVLGEDYLFRGFTGQGDSVAQVVFCGYGLSLPERGYDDYAGMDVTGKIVLVFKQGPGWKLTDNKDWQGMANPRPKANVAAAHGAVGVLLVSKPNDTNPQPLIGSVMHGDGDHAINIPQLQISQAVAQDLLQSSGLNLSNLQTDIDETRNPASAILKSNVRLKVETRYQKDSATWNVIGILPGSDPDLRDEFLVLGAHLDHVGNQTGPALFPGANDNASGSAAIMEIAEAFVRGGEAPRRSVVFVLFSGEEQGLTGSRFYADNPVRPLEKTVAMFNFDCIAHGDSIRIGSGKSSPVLWNKIMQLDAERDDLMIKGTWSGGGADATPFHQKGLPTLYFVTTNSYTHLHRISDTVDTLDGPLYEAITRLGYRMAAWVASGEYQKENLIK